MQKEKVETKEILMKQIKLIDDYFTKDKPIPYNEARKTFLLVGMVSKINEKNSISRVTNLRAEGDICYHTLQQSYRIISKEASFSLLNNPTDDNLAIILGQFGILLNLEKYLLEKEIPLNVLMEMNERTVKGIGESAKKFKKINHISR